MKFFVATALVASLAVTSAQFQGCARGKFGVYANPTDCSKYIMCVAGAPVAVTCPGKMKFDARIGTCSPFAKCNVAPVVEEPVHEEPHHEEPVHEEPHHEEPVHEEPHHEEPHHEEPVEEPHHEEPEPEEPAPAKFSCPRSAGRFSDPEDCKRYYLCKDGEAAHYQCPFKMNFSSKLGMCLPGVKCVKAPVPEEPVEEPHHEEPHHEEPHHEEPVEEPHHEEPHHEEPHHEEPVEEPHHEEPEPEEPVPAKFSCPRSAGRFSDPEDCKRYYLCKDGEAAHYQCPFKMNFSSKLGMCLPGVKCVKAPVPEEPVEEPHHEEPHHEEPHHEEPHHEEPHHEEPVEEPHHEEPHHEEPHHEEPVEEPKEEPIETGYACPRSNGRFADVHNCNQYHDCKDGQSQLKKCMFNFRFSRSLGMCLPGIKCVEEKVEEPVHEEPHHEEPHHEEPVEEPHHEEPHHEEPHHEEPHHEEPHHEEPVEEPHHEEPVEEPTGPIKFTCKKSFGLFADANDCGKYHMCVRGRAFTVSCPTNTKYDFINKHCIAATNARCMKTEEIKVEEEQPVQEEKAFECPVDFGLFPSSNGRKFIQCAHGQAHEMSCPAGTEWNQQAQACDHAQ